MTGQAIQKRLGSVTIRGARIIFRNFAGVEGQFNAAGDRNFGAVLDPETAAAMAEDGWNIKYLKPREEGDEPTPWIPVTVSFKNRPPNVVLITQRYNHETQEFVPIRTRLPEPTPEMDLISMLDYADFAKVDMMISPYTWSHSGRSGVKAYLKALYATIQQDELEREYAVIEEVPITGGNAPLAITANGEPLDDEIVIDENDIVEEFPG